MFITTSMDGRPRRREENSIYLYAAVNLKRNLRLVYCTIQATDRHEASRGLSVTVGLSLLVSRSTSDTIPERDTETDRQTDR